MILSKTSSRRFFRFFFVLFLAIGIAPLYGQSQQVRDRGLQQACQFAYYPSGNLLVVNFDFSRRNVRLNELYELGKNFTEAKVELFAKGSDEVLLEAEVALKDGQIEEPLQIKTPDLDGEYELRFTLQGEGGPIVVTREFVREVFPWEGNTLGVTDEVLPPFEPVLVDGNTVRVVGREYGLDGLGLFDSVTALDKEILAAPVRLKAKLQDGTILEVEPGELSLEESKPVRAVFSGSASGEGLRVESESVIEMDGLMTVNMTITPEQPLKLQSMWLEIPVKDEIASLFHQYVDGNRVNYAGTPPEGEGVLWTSAEARRHHEWQNTFCPYLWIGGPERGLAWFAENDKGWLTETGGSDKPIQILERSGDALVMKILLANHEVEFKEPMEVVFGLQASPTKPMPEDWRERLPDTPSMSGPVFPWGGVHCSSLVPWNYDWRIVDVITEGRRTGEPDLEWFDAFAKEHNPPKVFGVRPWEDRVKHFATVAASRGMKPYMVYTEEMLASQPSPEWQTFQDEWGVEGFTNREWQTYEVFDRGFNVNPSIRVSFPDSYNDYSVYYHNEWLKRGASLYWDNTNPKVTYDPIFSRAYETDDGKIQPALRIWEQREYQMRIYALLQYWRENQDFPLEWSLHTTNSQVLPLQTWATVQLDLEFSNTKPFPPDFIRTESIGRQVGNMPFVLYQLYGSLNPLVAPLDREEQTRINYGMCMTHEIRSHRAHALQEGYDALLYEDFGYAKPETLVFNYWEEEPVLDSGDDLVKWLAVVPEEGGALILLASWHPEETEVSLVLNDRFQELLGEITSAKNPETGEEYPLAEDGSITVALGAPYGVRFVQLVNN